MNAAPYFTIEPMFWQDLYSDWLRPMEESPPIYPT